MKENKKRIIFWGILGVILTVLSITGLICYYLGYGSKGSANKLLNPYINIFDNLEEVKKENIKSTINESNILITYNNETYTLDFSSINDNIIKMRFIKNDNSDLIVKCIIKTIYKYKNYKTDFINELDLDNISDYNIKNGFTIKEIADEYLLMVDTSIDYNNPVIQDEKQLTNNKYLNKEQIDELLLNNEMVTKDVIIKIIGNSIFIKDFNENNENTYDLIVDILKYKYDEEISKLFINENKTLPKESYTTYNFKILYKINNNEEIDSELFKNINNIIVIEYLKYNDFSSTSNN